MALEDRHDHVAAARRLQRDDIARDQALREDLKRVDARRDPARRPNVAAFRDRDLAEVAMNIQPEPAHRPPLVDDRRERGGTHDTDRFVLSAHRERSQGRPRTTPSSQLIGYDGLPVPVSQQRPFVPEPEGFQWRRTAVSSPDNTWTYTRNRGLRELLAARGLRHRTIPPRTPKR